jgi:DNA-binding transcriptional ArsR family regulator
MKMDSSVGQISNLPYIFRGVTMLLAANAQKTELTAKLFRGFADTSRLAILQSLRDGAITVGEIVAETGLTQSNVSNHLACLRDCGLVTTEQDGRFVYYTLSDKRVERFLNLADELLSHVARGVYECVHYEKPKRATLRRMKR